MQTLIHAVYLLKLLNTQKPLKDLLYTMPIFIYFFGFWVFWVFVFFYSTYFGCKIMQKPENLKICTEKTCSV